MVVVVWKGEGVGDVVWRGRKRLGGDLARVKVRAMSRGIMWGRICLVVDLVCFRW